MDINKILFSRTAPAKKAEIVKGLSQAELLAITPASIIKMVKEVGSRLYKSRDKELRLSDKPSNHWNAWVESVRTYRGVPKLDIYFQYENTDTNTTVDLEEFLKHGDFRGSVTRSDRFGNPRSYYFVFDDKDKAECVKAVALEYINRKYSDKL